MRDFALMAWVALTVSGLWICAGWTGILTENGTIIISMLTGLSGLGLVMFMAARILEDL